MGRGRAIAEHVIALPAALLLFAAVSLGAALTFPRLGADSHAIDLQVHDGYYVIAHFHLTGLVLACLVIACIVAVRHGGLNWALHMAGALLAFHLIASAVLWSQAQGARGSVERAGTFVLLGHSQAGWPEAFLWSGVGAIVSAALGLLVSFIGTLHAKKR